jgi:hypothetical protein
VNDELNTAPGVDTRLDAPGCRMESESDSVPETAAATSPGPLEDDYTPQVCVRNNENLCV